MHSNANMGRALKGYLKLSAISYRKTLTSFALTFAGIVGLILVGSALAAVYTQGSGSSNGGALTGGVLAGFITLMIAGFTETTNKEMSRVFAFPMSRQVWFVGNMIVTVGVAFSLSYVIAVIGGMEVIMARLLSSLVPRLIFSNSVSPSTYALGFWTTASYLVFFMSATYAGGMYFHRYKMPVIATTGAILVSFFVFPSSFRVFVEAIQFFIYEGNPGLLSLKLWGVALGLHILTWIPLRDREVRA